MDLVTFLKPLNFKAFAANPTPCHCGDVGQHFAIGESGEVTYIVRFGRPRSIIGRAITPRTCFYFVLKLSGNSAYRATVKPSLVDYLFTFDSGEDTAM